MIDFTLTDEQKLLKSNVRRFAETELKPIVAALEPLTDPWECFVETCFYARPISNRIFWSCHATSAGSPNWYRTEVSKAWQAFSNSASE